MLVKDDKSMIRKGDTFVQYQPRRTMIFMKVNNVEHTESMDFCTVTWHMMDTKGLNVQSRFPMAAPNGAFSGFAAIERKTYSDAVALMHDCDGKIKGSYSDSEKKSLAQNCRRKLVNMIKTNRCRTKCSPSITNDKTDRKSKQQKILHKD